MFKPEDTKVIYQALKFAELKHKGQVRKVSGLPYISHPIIVSYLVCQFKRSKNLHALIASSILHDVVEDCNIRPEVITKKFGMFISSIVFELTDDQAKIKAMGKVEYQKAKWVGISSYALTVKLCDRLSNLLDNPSDKSISSTIEIIQNLKQKRKLTKTHLVIISEIEKITNKP